LRITYLKHHQIDKSKWNAAIESSHNALVYALSWFLDIVSPGWNAIVMGDYEYLMPLTWRSKLGFNYLYQPIFIQQLGIFSKNAITENIVNDFISEIEAHFKYFDIQLNYANPRVDSKNFILRNTQLIDLSPSYEYLHKSYKKNHRKNLQKIEESDLIIDSNGTVLDFIDLTKEMFIKKGVNEIKPDDIEHLEKITDHSIKNNLAELYFGSLENEKCAAAFFLKWKNRVVVYTALNDLGRKVGAMFGIIDKYIKEHAGEDLIFDFAGSNIPGVKYRNLGFGARNEVYYRVTINNLPLPFKWLKR